LKEKNGLLCPRIIEVEVEITGEIKRHLVRCTLFSEEEEILAFGEVLSGKAWWKNIFNITN
jgi:hypothetical protein